MSPLHPRMIGTTLLSSLWHTGFCPTAFDMRLLRGLNPLDGQKWPHMSAHTSLYIIIWHEASGLATAFISKAASDAGTLSSCNQSEIWHLPSELCAHPFYGWVRALLPVTSC
ncbi:hypothetical protein COO60DRAFT_473263 [Scenedesmus sp. NREL 46B-D3]|nr:hypothetical protein COO60DRAFT_473263 [Scenedesmus sp. NREL 46B-D3]